MRQVLLFTAVFAFLAGPAQAQTVKLEIKDGRVTMDAAAAPARLILAEWAKVGGTKVVGGEKVTGAPMTLKFVNMPERQALDIILRNVAGYMAAPRLASSAPGSSSYDRILILPTSTASAPANAAMAPAPGGRGNVAPGQMTGMDRRIPMPRPPAIRQPDGDVPEDDPDPEPEPDAADTGVNPGQPVFTFPQPQMPGNQVFVPVPPNGNMPGAVPQINLQPNANGQPTIYNFVPQPGVAPPPTTGFGVIGSPTPGVVQQPVQQPGQVPPKPPPGA